MVSFVTGRLFDFYALPFCKPEDGGRTEHGSAWPLGAPLSRLGTSSTPYKFRMNVRLPLGLSWDHVHRLRRTSMSTMCSCGSLRYSAMTCGTIRQRISVAALFAQAHRKTAQCQHKFTPAVSQV
jgi:hypothetical protein